MLGWKNYVELHELKIIIIIILRIIIIIREIIAVHDMEWWVVSPIIIYDSLTEIKSKAQLNFAKRLAGIK